MQEAGRFGIQSTLYIITVEGHISLVLTSISSPCTGRGCFINNILSALDSWRGSPVIPRAMSFGGRSCTDSHLLGFPLSDWVLLYYSAFSTEFQFPSERRCTEMPNPDSWCLPSDGICSYVHFTIFWD